MRLTAPTEYSISACQLSLFLVIPNWVSAHTTNLCVGEWWSISHGWQYGVDGLNAVLRFTSGSTAAAGWFLDEMAPLWIVVTSWPGTNSVVVGDASENESPSIDTEDNDRSLLVLDWVLILLLMIPSLSTLGFLVAFLPSFVSSCICFRSRCTTSSWSLVLSSSGNVSIEQNDELILQESFLRNLIRCARSWEGVGWGSRWWRSVRWRCASVNLFAVSEVIVVVGVSGGLANGWYGFVVVRVVVACFPKLTGWHWLAVELQGAIVVEFMASYSMQSSIMSVSSYKSWW